MSVVDQLKRLFSGGNDEQQKILAAFSKYVKPDTIEKINQDPNLATNDFKIGLQEKEGEFIWLLVRPESGFLNLVTAVVDQIVASEGMIDCITGPLITAYFGWEPYSIETKSNRKTLAAGLMESMGKDLALIHGKSRGLIGYIGSESRLSYTVILARHRDLMRHLTGLEYGSSEEIPPDFFQGLG